MDRHPNPPRNQSATKSKNEDTKVLPDLSVTVTPGHTRTRRGSNKEARNNPTLHASAVDARIHTIVDKTINKEPKNGRKLSIAMRSSG